MALPFSAKKCVFLTLILGFIAGVSSSPAPKDVEWKKGRWVETLRSCQQRNYKEDFAVGSQHLKAPKSGPTTYERFGIKYVNLARVAVAQQFGSGIIRKDDRDSNSAAAAICGGLVSRNGTCDGTSVAMFALQPGSYAHAFRVNKLNFFCVKNGEPTPCSLRFLYFRSTNESKLSGPMESIDMVYKKDDSGFYPGVSWNNPAAGIVFKQLPPLQLFIITATADRDQVESKAMPFPAPIFGNTTSEERFAAFIDNVEFTVWECHFALPKRPLGGALKTILEQFTWDDQRQADTKTQNASCKEDTD